MRSPILLYLAFFLLNLSIAKSEVHSLEIKQVRVLSVSSAITPGTFDYLSHQLRDLPADSLIILKLNTPGGLVSTTKDIITLFNKNERPLAVWITPSGASAASAGAIIASSAHFIFMSPGTNMGAATPVGLNEDLKESDGKKKALNDLTALVRSQSVLRGRPSGPFESMITNADSYTDQEALKLRIIESTPDNLTELLNALSGKVITLAGRPTVLTIPAGIIPEERDPTFGQKLLEIVTHPSMAYFLFLSGLALLYFEFQAPGGYIAGGIGFTFLLISAIAFQVLPLHYGSLGLIALGTVFLFLEIFVPSYGLLSLAGLVAFVLGSLFLFKGETGYISVEYPVIFSTLAGIFFALGVFVWYFLGEKKKFKKENFFHPTDTPGIVMTKSSNSHYQVKVKGEIWNAESEESLLVGDEIIVYATDPEQLKVKIKKSTLPKENT